LDPEVSEPTKRVLLIIGGGIAAYKSLELIRLLQKRGIAVRAILTKAGSEFVTPLSVGALTQEKVFSDLFNLTDEAEMGHIELSRSADLVVVAPATADLMAKAANGHANDLASTALLATDKPVLMAPAMNVRMWEHPAVRRNAATLAADGTLFVGPDSGPMACGEFGAGRMAEPEAIAAEIEAFFNKSTKTTKSLAGRHAIVTAGPTREAIDPVRFLSNHSSGQQGYAIAAALADAGAKVTLVSGPTALAPPAGLTLRSVESALEMQAAVERALPADIFIGVAAVADWRPADQSDRKLKPKDKTAGTTLTLVANPDILAGIANLPKAKRPSLVIGFAAETHDVEAYAAAKRERKKADWIVANDVSGDVMGGGENEAVLITADGSTRWPRAPKTEIARKLVAAIAGSELLKS
jgi:phosphopantothenoylcysteine decarboxylase / phosphopantothenate---cysteine ligase